MNPLMLIAAFGSRVQVTETFTANTTWVAPPGTSRIDTLVGEGADGSPAYDDTVTTYWYDSYAYFVYSNGVQTEVGPAIYQNRWPRSSASEPKPGDFCYPPGTYVVDGWTTRQSCFFYLNGSTTTGGSSQASTGASATGFGKTFAGGKGGAATPVTYNNVAVTGGASYQIVVPPGGFIKITYYR